VTRGRWAALAGLVAVLAAYTAGAGHLWRAGLWPDALFLSLVLIPLTLTAVWLVLPLQYEPRLLLAGLVLGAIAVPLHLANLDVLFNLAKLFALVALGLWFLSLFETVAWAALVAAIIPWVDIWSVFFGPTEKITSDHPGLFEQISIAFRVPGGEGTANLGPPDVLFFALFVGAARRFSLRPGLTWIVMAALVAATLLLTVATETRGLPALPAIAFGFLLANADLLWRALRRRGRAPARIYGRGAGDFYDLDADVIERAPSKLVLLTRERPPVMASLEPVTRGAPFPVDQADAAATEVVCRLTIAGADAGEAVVHDLPHGVVVVPREQSAPDGHHVHPEQQAADEAKVERLRRERS
jgi:hypothetical protein